MPLPTSSANKLLDTYCPSDKPFRSSSFYRQRSADPAGRLLPHRCQPHLLKIVHLAPQRGPRRWWGEIRHLFGLTVRPIPHLECAICLMAWPITLRVPRCEYDYGVERPLMGRADLKAKEGGIRLKTVPQIPENLVLRFVGNMKKEQEIR